jgi:hypothetical protein
MEKYVNFNVIYMFVLENTLDIPIVMTFVILHFKIREFTWYLPAVPLVQYGAAGPPGLTKSIR